MPRGARIHRLPQRLDYALIPAPLDLSLADASEKSGLPSIIVTPSSPRETPESGYFLAFLAAPAPPPPPTLRSRLAAFFPRSPRSSAPAVQLPVDTPTKEGAEAPCARLPGARQLRARTAVLLLLLFFILACHFLTHRLAARRPALAFAAPVSAGSEATVAAAAAVPGAPADADAWWALEWLWNGGERADAADAKRDFIVEAFPTLSAHI